MSIRRPLILIALVLFAVLASGCEVALDIAINVEDDGGGTVVVQTVLDSEAVAAAPPDLAGELRTGDLVKSGWSISGPEDTGVSVIYTARKSFENVSELPNVLDEITGPNGMFQNFELTQESAFAESTLTLTGDLDLTRGVEIFNDPTITERFNGNPLGRPIAEFLAGGQTLDTAVPVQVSINLPGDATETALSEAVFRPRWSDTEPMPVIMSSHTENLVAQVLRWVGVAAGVLFVLASVLALFSLMLDRRSGDSDDYDNFMPHDPLPPRVPAPARSAATVSTAPRAAARPAGPELRCVVVEPLGALYEISDDPSEMMADFVQEKSGVTDRELVSARYHDVTLGTLSTTDYWHAVGLGHEDPETLDKEWTARFRPRIGAAEFLREMRNRSLPVAILTNDGARWSRLLRDRDNLVSLNPWMISSEIGARKPDPAVFEALRQEIQIPYERCLYIDTVVDDLDAGRTLGMQTAFLMSRRPRPQQRPNHPIISSYGDFFRR